MFCEERGKREYTQEELRKYEKYKEEYKFRMMSNRNQFPDYSISNNAGYAFDMEEWIDKPELHDFKGYNY